MDKGSGASKTTVLLADDEPLLRATMKEFLCGHGYHVAAAANGAEAIGIYDRQRASIHMVITDICMPEPEEGIALVRHIRQCDKTIPIVVITSYQEYRQVESSEGLNTAVFDKPVGLERLRQYLEHLAQTLRVRASQTLTGT